MRSENQYLSSSWSDPLLLELAGAMVVPSEQPPPPPLQSSATPNDTQPTANTAAGTGEWSLHSLLHFLRALLWVVEFLLSILVSFYDAISKNERLLHTLYSTSWFIPACTCMVIGVHSLPAHPALPVYAYVLIGCGAVVVILAGIAALACLLCCRRYCFHRWLKLDVSY